MLQTRVGTALRVATLTAVTALGSIGSAQAAVYVGKWDPAYGAPFAGLGFTGEATFYVPDACLSGPAFTAFVPDGAGCSGGAISLLSAKVNFYTFSGSFDVNTATFQQTRTYATQTSATTSNLTDASIDPVFGVYVQFNATTGKNEVVGASTQQFGPQTPTDPEITAITGIGTAFFLRFGPGALTGDWDSNDPVDGVGGDPGDPNEGNEIGLPNLPLSDFQRASLFEAGCTTGNCQSNPGIVTFTQVPEPGSLALVLGAIAAGWATRRPRRRSAAATR